MPEEDPVRIAGKYRFSCVTTELRDTASPVALFMKERFNLRDIQKQYRTQCPEIIVPGNLTAGEAAVLGTAADWQMRFLIHPEPDLHLASLGVMELDVLSGGIKGGFDQRGLLGQVNEVLRYEGGTGSFTGPVEGSKMEPETLCRACWGLALLTAVFRAGERAASALEGVESLMTACPPEGLKQLNMFRQVMEERLLPELSARKGRWILGPVFAGSSYMRGDGDLIAADLLLDLKTTKKNTLGGKDMYQIITYALMDWDDDYGLREFGFFNPRYGHLAVWDIRKLLDDLSGGAVTLDSARAEFRELLTGSSSKTAPYYYGGPSDGEIAILDPDTGMMTGWSYCGDDLRIQGSLQAYWKKRRTLEGYTCEPG